MGRIDPETHAVIREVLELCRAKGQDPVAMLDRSGFLRHASSRHADNLDLLDLMIEGTRAVPANLLVAELQRAPMSQQDMKNTIITFLENFRKGFALYKGQNSQ